MLLVAFPDVIAFVVEVFRVVAPIILSKITTPISMENGLKLPLPDSERQSPEVVFQPMPQQKRPVPLSDMIEIEMAPFGMTSACQRIHTRETERLPELTCLAVFWAGITVPRLVCASTKRYPVAVFIALVEAVTESSVVS